MILVIGGFAAGKREFVKKQYGYGEQDMAQAVLDDRPVLYDLQELVRRDPKRAAEFLPALLQKKIVICNETGSGVVPVDQAERDFREETGRLCILLAENAEKVVRIVCGIPQTLKESAPAMPFPKG